MNIPDIGGIVRIFVGPNRQHALLSASSVKEAHAWATVHVAALPADQKEQAWALYEPSPFNLLDGRDV
jgi:hypothetical protein